MQIQEQQKHQNKLPPKFVEDDLTCQECDSYRVEETATHTHCLECGMSWKK